MRVTEVLLLLPWLVIMETTKVLAFSDVAALSAGSASSSLAAGDADGGPLAKAHADSKEDEGSFAVPPWMRDYRDCRNGTGDCSRSYRGDHSDRGDDEDEIIPDSCGYYARRKSGCAKPRSCRDCLNLDDCMVNQFGACVNITKRGYEPEMDYHKAFEFNMVGVNATNTTQTTQRYHFPATNATYCAVGDAVCAECKTIKFAGDVTDSRFCVGTDNCLCIGSCEASGWEQLAGGMRCGPPPKPKAFAAQGPEIKTKKGEESSGVNWRDVWTMGGIPALVVVVGLVVIRSHRKETQRRAEVTRQQLEVDGENGVGGDAPASSGNTQRPGRLNLSGWRSLRQNQIKKENLLLDGAQEVSPKQHFVDLLNTQEGVNPEVTMLAAPVMGARLVEASAPPMSPHDPDGVEPSAPSFDSEFNYDQEELDMV